MAEGKKNGVSFQELYGVVQDMRAESKSNLTEVKQTIARLEAKFDTMEAGRLTKLEQEFAYQKGKGFFFTVIINAFITGTIAAFISWIVSK